MIIATREEVKLLEFDRIRDARGNLSFFENHSQIPFSIKGIEYFYDIPGGGGFKGYSCKHHKEVIIALSGSVDVIVDNGIERQCITLNRSYIGLYLPDQLWRQIKNFSTNSIVLVVSDSFYDDDDYVRNFKDFTLLKNE